MKALFDHPLRRYSDGAIPDDTSHLIRIRPSTICSLRRHLSCLAPKRRHYGREPVNARLPRSIPILDPEFNP